jgi:hypothetical protein
MANYNAFDSKFLVFDWDKAAKWIKELKPLYAKADLANYWDDTNGIIYRDGEIIEDKKMYLRSFWSKPILRLFYQDGNYHDITCYIEQKSWEEWQRDEPWSSFPWDGHTKWPESAREILEI